jgi:mRNA-degrading endonuclease RelE of RelBE toxin-antitoxin system
MPARTLKTPATVRSLIRQMHALLKRKVRAALTDILDDPDCGKPLEGELKGLWSLRVGRHRVIYRPDDAGAEVVTIGPQALPRLPFLLT